jgi:hypothetical protein
MGQRYSSVLFSEIPTLSLLKGRDPYALKDLWDEYPLSVAGCGDRDLP